MAATEPIPHEAAVAGQQTVVTPADSDRCIEYAEYGHPDGTPIVFFHGTPGSHRLGALLDSAARTRGIRVFAPSRPGNSHSTPWPSRSLGDAADSVLPVLDDANVQSAGLVGFSGGGPHALATAAEYPHRVTQVDLVSSATPPSISAERPVPQRLLGGLATRAPTVLRGLFRGGAWVASRLDPSAVVAQYTANGTTIADDVARVVEADFRTAFARHRSGAVTEFRNTATDWEIDYDAIDPEIRIWHGRTDTNVPIGDARRFERALPDADLRLSADADHLQTLLQNIPDILETHRRPGS
jgi:pimeloyl-ACP methyl ester carboxylesterase